MGETKRKPSGLTQTITHIPWSRRCPRPEIPLDPSHYLRAHATRCEERSSEKCDLTLNRPRAGVNAQLEKPEAFLQSGEGDRFTKRRLRQEFRNRRRDANRRLFPKRRRLSNKRPSGRENLPDVRNLLALTSRH